MTLCSDDRTFQDNLADLAQLFRLWLGVTEYLFRNPDLLDEAIDTAIDDKTFRSDDLEFTFAARVSLMYSPHPQILTCPRRGLTAFPLATSNRTVTGLRESSNTLRRGSRMLLALGTR